MSKWLKTLALVLIIAAGAFLSTSATAHADTGVSGDMNGDGYNDTAVINTNGAVGIFHGPGYWDPECRCQRYWATYYNVDPNWRTVNTQQTTWNKNLNIVVNYVCVTLCGASVKIVDDEMRTVRSYGLPFWNEYIPGPGTGPGIVEPTYLTLGRQATGVYVVNDVLGRVVSTTVGSAWNYVFLQDLTGNGVKDVVFHYDLGCDYQGCHQGWATFDPMANHTYWYQV